MLRTFTRLAAAVATLFVLATVQAGPAAADDADGCRIAPGRTFAFTGFCHNDRPASSYSVAFHVQAAPGSTYAWTLGGDWTSVVTGCGSADSYCTVTTRGSSYDHDVYAQTVVNGVTYWSSAAILMYCGTVYC